MSTFKISVVLVTAALAVAASSAAESVTRVEILDASGASVATQDANYVFTGIPAGDYTLRATLLDVNGTAIGTPYTQAFSAAPETRVVQVPSGATITVEAE